MLCKSKPMKTAKQFRQQGEKLAEKQRKIQEQISQADENQPAKKSEKPMQAGARKYPEP
jgi:hypothetical protein